MGLFITSKRAKVEVWAVIPLINILSRHIAMLQALACFRVVIGALNTAILECFLAVCQLFFNGFIFGFMAHALLQYRFLTSVYFEGRMSMAVNGFVGEYSFIQFIKYGILYSITLNNLRPKNSLQNSFVRFMPKSLCSGVSHS